MIRNLLEDIRLPEPGVYHVVRILSEILCMTALRLEVRGRENVPRTGPLIVACNHISYVDPVALGVAIPRPIWYMAKVELFRIPVLGPLITALNAYPVDRSRGDIAAIRNSVRQLKAGRAVGIFPEGTRNLHGQEQGRVGAALLASLSGAPVLPAFVRGGDRAKKLGKLQVAFGPVLRFGDGKATREDLANWTVEIMARIRALGESLGGD